MKLYSLEECENLIRSYTEKEGHVETIKEGSLGLGTVRLSAPGLKTITIREKYLNEWSSAHTITISRK